jgi:hypothetical protein
LHSLLEEFQDETSEEESNEEILDAVSSSKTGTPAEITSFSNILSSLEERNVTITDSEITREAPLELAEEAELVTEEKINDRQSNGFFEGNGALASPGIFIPTQYAIESNVTTINHVQFEDALLMISNEEADTINFLFHREGLSEDNTALSVSNCSSGPECRDEAEEDTPAVNTSEATTLRPVAADVANHPISVHHYAIQSEKIDFDITETISSRQWCKMIPFALEEKVCFCI